MAKRVADKTVSKGSSVMAQVPVAGPARSRPVSTSHGLRHLLLSVSSSALLVAALSAPQPARAVPITWNVDTDGSFNTSGAWNPAQVPTSADNTTIDRGATAVTVTSSGSNAVNSLTTGSNATLVINNGGTFTIGNGGSNAGTIQQNDNTFLNLSGILNNTGNITINSAGNLTDLRIFGATSLTGTGTVTMGNSTANRIYAPNAVDTLTIGSGQTIQGAGQLGAGAMGLNNQGLVLANQSNALTLQASSTGVTNSGTLRADGGTLVITGASGGTITQTGGGNISAQNGSTVSLVNNATIVGGTLSTANGGVIQTQNGHVATLSGVTNTGTFIGQDNTFTLLTGGTITNNGTMSLNSGGNTTDFRIVGGLTLSGSGSVNLGNSPNNRIIAQNGADTLINQQTIQGSGFIGSMGLNNQGTITANQSTALNIQANASGVSNSGTLQANGGTLVLNGSGSGAITQTGGGTIIAQTGSTVSLVNGISLIGGALNTVGTGVIQTQNGHTASLSNITNNGNFVGQDNSFTFLSGTINNTSTMSLNSAGNTTDFRIAGDNLAGTTDATLTGGGTLFLGNQNPNRIVGANGNDTLVNSATNKIQGAGQIGAGGLQLVNHGLVDANQTGTMTIQPMLGANGVVNDGILQASNTAAGNGGLRLQVGEFQNAGGTIQATGANTHVDLAANVTIHGGTLKTSGGGVIQTVNGNNATLDGVTNTGSFVGLDNTVTFLSGTTTNTGTIALASAGNNTDLRIVGNATITGSGSVNLGNQFANRIFAQNGADTLTNQQTIQGSGQIGVGSMALNNQGSIIANQSTALEIRANATGVSNTGNLIADGAILSLNGANNGTITQTGSGQILAKNNGIVDLVNNIVVAGGNLNTQTGGLVQTHSGHNATLSTLTNNGSFVGQDNSVTFLTGTITNPGTIALASAGNNTDLRIVGNATITGSGSVNLSNNFNNRIFAQNGADTLTNQQTIQGSGQIGVGSMALDNQGSIIANQSNALEIRGNATGTTNSGSLIADGATLSLNGVNGGAVTQTGGGQILAKNNGVVTLVNNMVVSGGSLNTQTGGVVQTQSGHNATLSGLTNNGTFIGQDNSTTFLTGGTITNTGSMQLSSLGNNTDMRIIGNLTLAGAGSLTLSNGANNRIFAQNGSDTLTNGPNHTIQGAGQLGTGGMGLTNKGLIDANQSNSLVVNLGSSNASLNDTTGTLRASAGGGMVLQNGSYTNNGTVEALNGSGLTYQSTATNTNSDGAGTLTGGTWRSVGAGSTVSVTGGPVVTNAANIVLSGGGSVFQAGDGTTFTALESSLTSVASGGQLHILNNRSYTTANALSNSGKVELGGGTLTGLSLTNNASGEIFGFGTLANRPDNSGLIRANGGTLTAALGITGQSGSTVTIDSGAALNLSTSPTGSSTGTLNHNGTNLNLGSQNLVVSKDYTNANFGVGNSFDKRANVTGTGQIIASGNTGQSVSGANVVAGTTATPTLSFGDIHVGAAAPNNSATRTFQINNTGSTGPDLRGAIQTAAGGGNVTDGRLSGTGVTAQNFGPIAPGSSTGSYSVTFSGTSGGAGILSGQTIHIANDFGNVAEQTVALSGTAWNLAAANVGNIQPIQLGNRHVGDASPSVALNIGNSAPVGAFTEKLNGAAGSGTGGITVAGSFTGVAAGSSSSAISVGMDTSTAGAKSGTAGVNFVSDGTGLNTLGQTALAAQNIQVQGAVYRLAQANTIATVNFGNVHVGDTVSQGLGIQNLAINDGFSEKLNASFGTTTDARITTSGSISLLGAGASDNTSMVVGLNTAAAGSVNGSAQVKLQSDGTGTSGLGITNLATQDVGVTGNITTSGNVFRLANAQILDTQPVDFGKRRVGDVVGPIGLNIKNNVPNDGFSESLNAAANGASAGFSSAGSFNLLAAGATNSGGVSVGMSTASAGHQTGTATVNFVSDGQGTSNLGQTALASQNVNLVGDVYRLASASQHTPEPVNLGSVRVGGSAQQALSLSNTALNDGFSEKLNAAIGGATTGVTASGSFNQLAAGATNNSSLVVGLDSSTSGVKSGTATITLASDGTGTSGFSALGIGSQTVNVTGKVYAAAVPVVQTASVDFGIVHRGDVVTQRVVSVQNNASGALTDVLTGGFGTVSVPFSGNGTLGGGVAAGATDGTSLKIGLNTGASGVFGGIANLALASHNDDMTDLAVATGSVSLSATVNEYAKAAFKKFSPGGSLGGSGAVFTLDLGSVLLGSDVAAIELGALNDVLGPADLLSGSFDVGAGGFLLAGFGPFAGIGAGDAFRGLMVDFDPTQLGSFNETITLFARGSNASGFDEALDPITLQLHITVAENVESVPEPGSLALLLSGLGALGLTLRRRLAKASIAVA